MLYCTTLGQIVAGIQSDVVQKKLSEHELTVEKTINICWALVKASVGMESLKNNKHPNEVAWVKAKANSGKNTNIKDSKDIETYSENKCKFCPSNYPFGRKNCSAWGKSVISVRKGTILQRIPFMEIIRLT